MGILFKLKSTCLEYHHVSSCTAIVTIIHWQNSSKTPRVSLLQVRSAFPYLTASEAKCWVSYQLMFSILKVKEMKLNTCKNTAKPDIK